MVFRAGNDSFQITCLPQIMIEKYMVSQDIWSLITKRYVGLLFADCWAVFKCCLCDRIRIRPFLELLLLPHLLDLFISFSSKVFSGKQRWLSRFDSLSIKQLWHLCIFSWLGARKIRCTDIRLRLLEASYNVEISHQKYYYRLNCSTQIHGPPTNFASEYVEQ